MTPESLAEVYGRYIDCLNARDWDRLHVFVHEEVRHNAGHSAFRDMLERDVLEGNSRAIPDLRFSIGLLIAQPPASAPACSSTAPPPDCSSDWRSTAGA